MRPCTLLLAICFSARLFAQSCVTFAGPEVSVPLYDGNALTLLLLQPDGSYSAVRLKAVSPYNIFNVVPHFEQSIGSCNTPPGTTALPEVSLVPAALGTASSVVDFGSFSSSVFLSGVFTTTPSPQPYASVGLLGDTM